MTLISDAPAREAKSPEARRTPSWMVGAVGAIVATGFALFFFTRSDMWLDEALTVNIARLPLTEFRDALERDGAPPLYYALLHIWTGAFGDGDVAARSLSGVFAVGAVTVSWFAARRWFDTTTAWLAVVVMVANPYMTRYATEARMYSLEVLLVACGLVVVPRALERPSWARLAAVALVTALLVYNQYWSFYLVGVTALTLLLVGWRVPTRRRTSLLVLASIALGLLAFLPWFPTFLSQSANTGTPWGDAVLPGIPIGTTLLDFSGGAEQEGWVLLFVLVALLLVGVFGRAVDAHRLEVDLRAQPQARWLAVVGGATLVVGATLNYLAGQAFQPRYSALVFPFFALLCARGLATLSDPKVRIGSLAVVVGLGLVGGVRNATTQRTQAEEVAAVLRVDAEPGDIIVYCPDQLGPSVHRLLPSGLDEVTFPAFAEPDLVNWVDYQARIDATEPVAFADQVAERAGDRPIWLVTGPGYPKVEDRCAGLTNALASTRRFTQRVEPDDEVFESPGLQEFAPSNP